MPKTRNTHRKTAPIPVRRAPAAPRRTVTTVGDLIMAAYQAAGSALGAARLLDQSSPLGHLLNRRIVIG